MKTNHAVDAIQTYDDHDIDIDSDNVQEENDKPQVEDNNLDESAVKHHDTPDQTHYDDSDDMNASGSNDPTSVTHRRMQRRN